MNTDNHTAEQRLLELLKNVAVEIRPCKFCSVTIYFVPSNQGKIIPYTAAGVNHFQDCPRFQRRPPDPAQETLFPALPGSTVSGFDPVQ